MQNIEKALFNVISFIGSNYNLPDPEAEFLTNVFDGSEIRNPYFGQTPQAIKFEMGTQKEVDEWISQNTDKYPVCWLVYPDAATRVNTPGSIEAHRRTRLVFAVNCAADVSVKTRLHTTRVELDNIVDKFLELMRNSSFKKYIWLDKNTPYTRAFRPNKSSDDNESQKRGKTADPWDVITLDCDIYFRPSCIPVIVPASTPEQ